MGISHQAFNPGGDFCWVGGLPKEYFQQAGVTLYTPLKFNMAPEKWLEDDLPFEMVNFQWQTAKFSGCTLVVLFSSFKLKLVLSGNGSMVGC